MIFLNKIKSIAKYRGLNIDPPEKKNIYIGATIYIIFLNLSKTFGNATIKTMLGDVKDQANIKYSWHAEMNQFPISALLSP